MGEIEDYDRAAALIRGGMAGAALYAVWLLFIAVMGFAFGGGALLAGLTPSGQFLLVAILAAQFALALLAAWRFWLGKGAITGGAAALVVLAQLVLMIIDNGLRGMIWYAVLLGVLLALIGGIRGALAIPGLHDPTEETQAFE